MNLVYERCAGIDVHKRTIVVCAIVPDAKGQRRKERRTFSTMTPDLLRMRPEDAGGCQPQAGVGGERASWAGRRVTC